MPNGEASHQSREQVPIGTPFRLCKCRSMTNVAAIIVAAGSGERAAGAGPKQFQPLLGRRMLDWSVDAFFSHPKVSQTVVVLPEEWLREFIQPSVNIAAGGKTRTESVKAGLAALNDTIDTVLIHDAARPGVTAEIINALLDALIGHDAAAPALPVVDTLKRVDDQTFHTIDRSKLFRIQTPQAFHRSVIKTALTGENRALFDDLQAVEASGASVTLVSGEERLSKITYPEDFDRIARLMAPTQSIPRIGKGFDVHAFGPGETVTLCGVSIPFEKGLVGHSDADVAWHALTDAIFGALALGDIGDHFPPSDQRWKGAASSVFLQAAADKAAEAGYVIANCDITIICEQPKIKPHREAMRAATAECLRLDIGTVSVKATTTEQLGFTGRGEGLAAEAIVLLSPLIKGA